MLQIYLSHVYPEQVIWDIHVNTKTKLIKDHPKFSICFTAVIFSKKSLPNQDSGPWGPADYSNPHIFPNITLKQLLFQTFIVKFSMTTCKWLYFYHYPYFTRHFAAPFLIMYDKQGSVFNHGVKERETEGQMNFRSHISRVSKSFTMSTFTEIMANWPPCLVLVTFFISCCTLPFS